MKSVKNYENLCKEVEESLHREMKTPQDFDFLSEKVMEKTHENVSPSTLMRLWGYRRSVSTRMSTLDIMSRFLGYEDYSHFSYLHEGKDGITKNTSMKWIIIAVLITFLILGGGAYYILNRPSPPRILTSLSELSNTKQYYIHTRNKQRGSLGVYQRQLATTYLHAQQHQCDTVSTFAIIQYEGDFYLYSVADKRFINFGVHETDAPMSGEMCALRVYEMDSCFVIDYKNTSTPCTLNVNREYGVFVTDYGTINRLYDDGNLFVLEEVGDFDPSEALAMLAEPNEEFVAATNNIKPEAQYAIYTCYDGNGNVGKKRHYLTANGYLTDALADSCVFTFHQIEGDSLYRSPAWRISSHTSSNGKAVEICFSNRMPHEDGQIQLFGYLRTEPFYRNDWQGKVLYLDNHGYYAIRATAMPIEWWGAGTYWAVYDNDGDGCPEPDYSAERAYVWQLEPM